MNYILLIDGSVNVVYLVLKKKKVNMLICVTFWILEIGHYRLKDIAYDFHYFMNLFRFLKFN